VFGFRLAGCLVILEVADEDAGAAVEDLAAVVDPDLHLRGRLADRVGANLPIWLDRDEDAGLRLSVELLEVHAERTVEAEHLGADRLAGGITDTSPRKAQRDLQRAVDQQMTEPVLQPVAHPHRLAIP